jgi:hypothetical protein
MSSVDDDGYSFQLFTKILGHEKDAKVALTKKEATISQRRHVGSYGYNGRMDLRAT